MKVNAPEKIYLNPLLTEDGESIVRRCTFERQRDSQIEYARTDAFIEKVLKWYCLDCACNDTCSITCYFKSTFKKYLEGDDKQLPPKIENAINPDGSTTENYRYRHFISRMQDAFIEKACTWLKNHYRDYMYNPTGKRLEAFFGGDMCNDFENYMKGE